MAHFCHLPNTTLPVLVKYKWNNFVDLCWPSLAVVAYCGPSWACVVGKEIRNKLYIEKNIPNSGPKDASSFGPFFVLVGQHWPKPSLAVVEVEVVELKPNRKYQQN